MLRPGFLKAAGAGSGQETCLGISRLREDTGYQPAQAPKEQSPTTSPGCAPATSANLAATAIALPPPPQQIKLTPKSARRGDR